MTAQLQSVIRPNYINEVINLQHNSRERKSTNFQHARTVQRIEILIGKMVANHFSELQTEMVQLLLLALFVFNISLTVNFSDYLKNFKLIKKFYHLCNNFSEESNILSEFPSMFERLRISTN